MKDTKSINWFIKRVGKYVMAESPTYNGMMKITDKEHASYLCYASQKYFHFTFSELEKQPFENSQITEP